MTPIIPQEIIDLVIDDLALGKANNLDSHCQARQALLACSLVSHSFCYRSQQHLFSRVLITSSPKVHQTQQLRDIMKQSTRLCSYIVTVEIAIYDKEFAYREGKQAATTTSGIPEILDILANSTSHPRSENTRIQLVLYSLSTYLRWGQLSKEFVFSLTRLMHKYGSALKALHISGFYKLPASIITNCLPTLQSLSITSFTFETVEEQSTRLSRDEIDNPPLNHLSGIVPASSFPVCRREAINPLSCISSSQTASYQLRDLDIFLVRGSIDLVAGIIQLTFPTLESLKLETDLQRAMQQWPDFSKYIDLSQLSSLRFLKLAGRIKLNTDFSVSVLLSRLLSMFAPAMQTPLLVETLELVLCVTNFAKQEVEDAIPSTDGWHELGKELNTARFPRLCRVDFLLKVTTYYVRLPKYKKLDKQRSVKNTLKSCLADLYGSPISVNIRVELETALSHVPQSWQSLSPSPEGPPKPTY